MEPEIWIVAAVRRGHADPEVCGQIRADCERRGWAHRLVRAELRTNSAGKLIALLDPELASNLYQRSHRTRLGVLATVDAHVRLNPTRHVLDEKWLCRLPRLVRYKAFYARVSSHDLRLTFSRFETWLDEQPITNERDPRLLPLQSFCPKTDCAGLDLAEARSGFDVRFGPPTKRVCEQGMDWTPDPSAHAGREPQNVAGLTLTPGLHWDVERRRGSARLLTLVDVWEPRHGHLNVYPNGFVRPGKGARRVDTDRANGRAGRSGRKK